jgi:hypothetical protein
LATKSISVLAPFSPPTLLKSSEEFPAGLIRVAMIDSTVPYHLEKSHLDQLLYPATDRSAVNQKETGNGFLRRITSTGLTIKVVQKDNSNSLFGAVELVG